MKPGLEDTAPAPPPTVPVASPASPASPGDCTATLAPATPCSAAGPGSGDDPAAGVLPGQQLGHFRVERRYVAGETIAERIARGSLPADDALEVIRCAALGLREAQRSGFLHRDVKPSNLMVDAHGVVKVLDFGLAAGAPGAGAAGVGAADGAPIEQTSLAGTPLYMAPEQARGDAVDLRADIYALGVTLFHLVSGRPPFVADTAVELVELHATAERPTLPRRGAARAQRDAIDALCARMMAAREELATTLLVFAAYQAIAVARWGRTAGKALFELEVVDIAALARPSLPTATRRALAMVGLPALALWVQDVLEAAGFERAANLVGIGVVLLVVLGGLLYASLRSAGKRALWDRLTGTMVRYRTSRPTGQLRHLVR